MRVVLIGGIGAGKSAAREVFAGLGALVVDADAIGHSVLEPGGVAHSAVAGRWPEVVADGVIDRRALGRIVFSDPEQLAELEAITHPAIVSRIAEVVGSAPADGLVMVELPLLDHFLGEGWITVVVDAPDETRRARLRARGMEDDEISMRLEVQPDRAQWLSGADFVVDNSGDRELLGAGVSRVWEALTGD